MCNWWACVLSTLVCWSSGQVAALTIPVGATSIRIVHLLKPLEGTLGKREERVVRKGEGGYTKRVVREGGR